MTTEMTMNDLISRSALRQTIESKIYWGGVGLLEAIDDAPAVNPLPCKIGATVWAFRFSFGKPCIRQGVVSEMAYLEDMRLAIAVKSGKYSARGFWGKDIFATYEECVAAIGGKDNERKAD